MMNVDGGCSHNKIVDSENKRRMTNCTRKEKVYSWKLRLTEGDGYMPLHPPTVHIAHGFDHHLPFLKTSKRPLICISDWQYETRTQRQLWERTLPILEAELGDKELLRSAFVLVVGDMASSNNHLLGRASDDVPKLDWLHDSFPHGDVFMIYGNHDNISQDHLTRVNVGSSNLPCLLPHGTPLSVPLRPKEKEGKTQGTRSNSINDGSPGDSLFVENEVRCNDDRPGNESCSTAKKGKGTPHETIHAVKQHKIINKKSTEKVKITPGMTKAERAVSYAKVKSEKLPKPSKLEKQNRQWRTQNPEQARLADGIKKGQTSTKKENKAKGGGVIADRKTHPQRRSSVLRIGAVHGIPASHDEGLKKIQRASYFETLSNICSHPQLDVLVTHSNPRLPGQEWQVEGEDAGRIYNEFLRSSARLHVHGHMHADPVVLVVQEGKIVVNSDCRVVVFVPEID